MAVMWFRNMTVGCKLVSGDTANFLCCSAISEMLSAVPRVHIVECRHSNPARRFNYLYCRCKTTSECGVISDLM